MAIDTLQLPPTHHGNPTIRIPFSHQGGRAIVRAREKHEDLWISHGMPAGVDATQVDVSHGYFAGSAVGCACLPIGTYDVYWTGARRERDNTADPQCIGGFDVRERTLTDCASFTSEGGWQVPRSLPNGQFAAYFWGAMHGTLAATFERRHASSESRWGLIARHYNAFHHMRVVCSERDGKQVIQLVRLANEPPDRVSHRVIAEQVLARCGEAPQTLSWSFNGDRHIVSINDIQVIDARDSYMGGVEIIGVFSSDPGIRCVQARVYTTQWTLRHTIARPRYVASIRPGNVDRLSFAMPDGQMSPNICWDSGIQFGHIGGSEIKFTQGARLDLIDEGKVATSVAWQGPMPKFVDQSHDVRGLAQGTAYFFDDHFVIADDVLAWTQRSVGPDIDLLGALMAGPARVALAGEEAFADWTLPDSGAMAFLKSSAQSGMFPAAALFPLRFGQQTMWLKVLVLLRYPSPQQTPASAFAWQCPCGLTASHDFRCSPTVPGQEYGFTIVVGWQPNGAHDPAGAERSLLDWRRSWMTPMRIEALAGGGQTVRYSKSLPARDEPREAMNFSDCFDLASGRYVIAAAAGPKLSLKLDPAGIARVRPSFVIRTAHRWADLQSCRLDDRLLQADADYVWQASPGNGEIWIRLSCTVSQLSRLTLTFAERPEDRDT